MNLLNNVAIRIDLNNGGSRVATLPGLLAALARGEVAAFPALRAHQRHAFHAFCVQLAAIALHRAGLAEPPETEDEWRELLRRLTPEFPDDEPWCLVSPPDKPALLQPPIPSGNLAELKNRIATPDGLDMLVTSKNHDLKQAVMAEASAEDWLFALVTLQTMEGFLGAGNYGISRMNGGFANRAAISLAPPGGISAHWRRDVQQLLALRGRLGPDYPAEGGIALVWLQPWDGASSLSPTKLDEYYIEICRRIRLTDEHGRLIAHAGSSKAARIVGLEGGVTGDPWSPVVVEKAGTAKALTINGAGLGYRRMVEFVFNTQAAPLFAEAADDAKQGLHVIARALVRGQGKTEGYHERRVPVSAKVKRGSRSAFSDDVAKCATERVKLAGTMQNRALKPALLTLFQNGPDKINNDDKDSQRKADSFLKRFDAAVDRDFFDALWREAEQEGDAGRVERRRWVQNLYAIAESLLTDAEHEAARSSRRSFRALVKAQSRLHVAAHFGNELKEFFDKESAA